MIHQFGDSDYLSFTKRIREPNKLTDKWEVASNNGDMLGVVSWHSTWRRYTFCPDKMTRFDEQCLMDLADFLRLATAAQQKDASQRRAGK